MKSKNKEIPVVLFVFNRHKQLHKTLEGLKKNRIPLLYVFADGPRSSADDYDIQSVRQIIDSISWTKVVKIYHQKNRGLSQSIQFGLDKVFEQHTSAIVVEDDIYVAPGFYEYMAQGLNKYRGDDRIAGITGLRYPFNKSNLSSDQSDVFITPRFSSWGWGTWENRWKKISFSEKSLLNKLERRGVDYSIGGEDLPSAIQAIKDGTLTGCWDVFFYMNMLLNDTYFVWPKFNYIINTGLTEGSHASDSSAPWWKLKWEKQPNRSLQLPDSPIVNQKILEDFLAFFTPGSLSRIKEEGFMPKYVTKIKRLVRKSTNNGQLKPALPDPSDYSTTDAPAEVPCQKEVYYYALNNLIRPGAKVLDVGLGLGYGMAILSVRAGSVSGVDVDKKAVDYATNEYLGKNPKIKSIQAYDGYNLPFKDNSFDVVTCVDVLEHVEDYDRFIDELLRVSKRYVVFGTPNRRPEFTNPDGTPKNHWHLREWTKPELDKILKKHASNIEWRLIDGPFDGPFKISRKVGKDTLVLMPILTKRSRSKK